MICKGSNVITTKTKKIIIMYKFVGTIYSGFLLLVAYYVNLIMVTIL